MARQWQCLKTLAFCKKIHFWWNVKKLKFSGLTVAQKYMFNYPSLRPCFFFENPLFLKNRRFYPDSDSEKMLVPKNLSFVTWQWLRKMFRKFSLLDSLWARPKYICLESAYIDLVADQKNTCSMARIQCLQTLVFLGWKWLRTFWKNPFLVAWYRLRKNVKKSKFSGLTVTQHSCLIIHAWGLGILFWKLTFCEKIDIFPKSS